MNVTFQPAPPSPCINICVMDDATGWCQGCFRSLDEIASWGNSDTAQKRKVLDDLPRRELAFFKKIT